MIPKYTVDYRTQFKKHSQVDHFSTDDPITCGEVLEEMLDRGMKIEAIKHEGVDLPQREADGMIKMAAAALAGRRICVSLGLKGEEEKYRFGFTA